jgi:hypothetical protein
MLNRKPLCTLQRGRETGIYHIRETQQSHPTSVSQGPAPPLVFCPFANRCKWEKYLLSGNGEALAMTQAALIGQTFAILSGVGWSFS